MILVSTSWNSAHSTDTIIENGFFVWMVGNYDYLLLDGFLSMFGFVIVWYGVLLQFSSALQC